MVSKDEIVAQKLVNGAACLLELNQSKRAVGNLITSLKLQQRLEKKKRLHQDHISLKICLTYSEKVSFYSSKKAKAVRRLQRHRQNQSTKSTFRYIYETPLRIPKTWIGQPLGRVLYAITCVNLALALYLSALEEPIGSYARCKQLTRAKELYEKLHCLCSADIDSIHPCLGLSMIVVNNLAELNNYLNESEIHTKYMQILLSIAMSCHREKTHRTGLGKKSIEGFFQNLSFLILQNKCASAA